MNSDSVSPRTMSHKQHNKIQASFRWFCFRDDAQSVRSFKNICSLQETGVLISYNCLIYNQ